MKLLSAVVAAWFLSSTATIFHYERALFDARAKQQKAERALISEMTRKPKHCPKPAEEIRWVTNIR